MGHSVPSVIALTITVGSRFCSSLGPICTQTANVLALADLMARLAAKAARSSHLPIGSWLRSLRQLHMGPAPIGCMTRYNNLVQVGRGADPRNGRCKLYLCVMRALLGGTSVHKLPRDH